jgi:hypothetical protein
LGLLNLHTGAEDVNDDGGYAGEVGEEAGQIQQFAV